MAKVKHYVKDDKIIRETKTGNKVEYKEISQDEFERYETGQSVFGCIGYVVVFVIFVLFLADII